MELDALVKIQWALLGVKGQTDLIGGLDKIRWPEPGTKDVGANGENIGLIGGNKWHPLNLPEILLPQGIAVMETIPEIVAQHRASLVALVGLFDRGMSDQGVVELGTAESVETGVQGASERIIHLTTQFHTGIPYIKIVVCRQTCKPFCP